MRTMKGDDDDALDHVAAAGGRVGEEVEALQHEETGGQDEDRPTNEGFPSSWVAFSSFFVWAGGLGCATLPARGVIGGRAVSPTPRRLGTGPRPGRESAY